MARKALDTIKDKMTDGLPLSPRSPQSPRVSKSISANVLAPDAQSPEGLREGAIKVPIHVREQLSFRIASNPIFRIAVNITIVINAAQMGIAADYKGLPWDDVWLVCDHVFTAAFAMEMIIQILALRHFYFLDPWYLLDFVIANVAIIDTWLLPLVSTSTNHMGAFRAFRLLRLLRMLKLMHMVPELMIVAEGLFASMKSMFWIFVLLFLVLYSAAICCVEVIGIEPTDYPARSSNQDAINSEVVDPFNSYLYFGTVMRSMLSLLGVVLMAEWGQVSRPVFEKQTLMVMLLIAMVILCSFGLLNVIIGVVVERTTEAMNGVRKHQLEKEKERQMKEAEKLAEIMFQLDEDHNGRISRAEMEQGSENPELRQMLKEIAFPADFTFAELFNSLDRDGSGTLSRNEFVVGIMRMIYSSPFQRECVTLSSLGQVQQVNLQTRKEVHHKLETFADDVRTDIANLRQEIRATLAVIGAGQTHKLDAKDSLSSSSVSLPAVNVNIFEELPQSKDSKAIEQRHSKATLPNISEKDISGNDAARTAERSTAEKNGIITFANSPSTLRSEEANPNEWLTLHNTAHPLRQTSEVSRSAEQSEAQSFWEPLQMSMVPARLMTFHAPVGSRISASLVGSTPKSPRQRVIGFLPIVRQEDGGCAIVNLARLSL